MPGVDRGWVYTELIGYQGGLTALLLAALYGLAAYVGIDLPIGWFTPGGEEMSEEDWQAGFAKSLGVFLNGIPIFTAELKNPLNAREKGQEAVPADFLRWSSCCCSAPCVSASARSRRSC